MRRFRFPLMVLLLSASTSFLTQGCTIRFVQGPQATPVPYPNAWHIELRVRAQLNRISTGLQTGQLSQDSANALAENDALVRRFTRDFQGPPSQTADLTAGETSTLDNMLIDNDRFIDDAFQRNQTWVSYFQGGNYDYTSSDRTVFIASLDYQLNSQQAGVKDGLNSGSLTNTQAWDLQNRIQVIRDLKQNDYRSNGRIALSEDQVRQLSQMTEDNTRYLRFRLKGNQGRWTKDNFTTWKKRTPLGLGQGGNDNWGSNHVDQPVQTTAAPMTSQPAPNPAFTPMPAVRPNVFTPVPNHAGGGGILPAQASNSLRPAPTSTPIPSIGQGHALPTTSAMPTFTGVIQPPAHTSASFGPETKSAPTAVPPAATPVVISKPISTPPPAQAKLRLLPPGIVVSSLKHADQLVQTAVGSGKLDNSQVKTLNGKLAALHVKASDDLKKNGANSVTKEQMDELSGMVTDINKFIQNAAVSSKEKEPSEHGRPKEP